MFYENRNNVYMPQIGDKVYFMFQGYEECVGYYPYHFITLEEERNKPINSYFDMFLNDDKILRESRLTHSPVE